MDNNMESALLKVFVAVANKKSISLGASILNFTQSNVTLRIKQLEKNLGYLLLWSFFDILLCFFLAFLAPHSQRNDTLQ